MLESELVAEQEDVMPGQLVMPFYIVCDVSYSMSGDIGQLNGLLGDLRSAILAEPAVDDVARISVIAFSDTAEIEVPLMQVSKVQVPHLAVRSGTNYGAAFHRLAETIESDRASLKAQGYKAYRPCAFFLTDGEPQDGDWAETFQATLTYDKNTQRGMKSHPIFVPFGFRDAVGTDLARLAFPPDKSRWFLADTTSASDALAVILNIIQNSVIATSRRASGGERGALEVPEPAAGSGIVSGESAYDPDFLD
jgi:uncharacterized protein YegL